MMRSDAQRGMSLVGLLVVLAVVGLGATLVFRTLPHYLDYFALKKLATTAQQHGQPGLDSADALRVHFQRGMQLNNIRDVDLSKALTVSDEGSRLLGRLKYEQREPLVGNLDLVMKFDHEFSVSQP